MRLFLCFCLAIVLLPMVASCGGDDSDEILVSAAASLTGLMERLDQQYTEAEGIRVRFNLGGSTPLAQQIVRGAPADVFVPAGPGPMRRLEAEGLLDPGSRVDLLTNELVVVGPWGTQQPGSRRVQEMLLGAGRLSIADPDLAPAGHYAREALRNLGIWEELESRLVYGTDVRVALRYVETRNVDLAIVYLTDALANDDVTVLWTLPEDSHSPIVYPAAVLAGSKHLKAARGFLEFLQSPQAGATFREFGFVPAGSE